MKQAMPARRSEAPDPGVSAPSHRFEVVGEHSTPDPAQATAPKAPAESITVVGIGADGFEELGHGAQAAVHRAEVVIGSWRQLNLLPETIRAERRPWPSPMLPAVEPMFREFSGMHVVVLASGDPMFHGVGSTLSRILGHDRIRVIPAPSSASLACARLGWPLDRTPVASLVTRATETLIPLIDSGVRFLVLGRDEYSAGDIARLLSERDLGEVQLTVLSDLGSQDEEIATGTAAQPPRPVSSLNVIAVEPAPGVARHTRSLLPGLPDESFEHDGQLTKSDVRALTVSALRPVPGELLWDIGGGSGSVAIEWLRSVGLAGGGGTRARAEAVCFEADPERAARISRNAVTLGVPWLQVMGAAPGALRQARYPQGRTADAPDAIFIGGGLTTDTLPETAWELLRPGGRIVANAVTVESEQKLIELRRTYGGSLRRIQIATEHAVGGFTTFRPALPITQWRATKALTPEGV